MNKAILLILPVSLLLFSCKSSKESFKTSRKLSIDSVSVELANRQIQYEWFAAKAKVNYEDKNQTKGFTATIRMRKDSLIWISVTTLMGIEAARVLITTDSVYLINRLNKIFQKEHFSLLEQYFPFTFDITLLQKILIGDAMLLPSDRSKIKQEKDQFILYSENKIYKHTIHLKAADLTISTEYLADKQYNRNVSLVFDNYKNDDGRLFSFSRSINFSGDEDILLTLKFSKIRWDEPQTFPFHVSDRYEEY